MLSVSWVIWGFSAISRRNSKKHFQSKLYLVIRPSYQLWARSFLKSYVGRLAVIRAPFGLSWALDVFRFFFRKSRRCDAGFSERISIPRIVKATGVQANHSRFIRQAGIRLHYQVFLWIFPKSFFDNPKRGGLCPWTRGPCCRNLDGGAWLIGPELGWDGPFSGRLSVRW